MENPVRYLSAAFVAVFGSFSEEQKVEDLHYHLCKKKMTEMNSGLFLYHINRLGIEISRLNRG